MSRSLELPPSLWHNGSRGGRDIDPSMDEVMVLREKVALITKLLDLGTEIAAGYGALVLPHGPLD